MTLCRRIAACAPLLLLLLALACSSPEPASEGPKALRDPDTEAAMAERKAAAEKFHDQLDEALPPEEEIEEVDVVVDETGETPETPEDDDQP